MTNHIGAPNSVARYLSENTFGDNKFIVLERINGEFVLVAAQTTFEGARRYMLPGRELVDVVNCRIIHESQLGQRTIKSFCIDLNGTLKCQLYTSVEENPIIAEQFGKDTWTIWESSDPMCIRRFLSEDDARRAYMSAMVHGTNGHSL